MKQKLERNFKHTSRSAPTIVTNGVFTRPINGLINGLTELITPISGSEIHPYFSLPAEYLGLFSKKSRPSYLTYPQPQPKKTKMPCLFSLHKWQVIPFPTTSCLPCPRPRPSFVSVPAQGFHANRCDGTCHKGRSCQS